MSAQVQQADKLRLEGNNLYKEGKFLKAIQKYRDAAKVVPEDATPLGNLSAAYYEIGKYKQCITRIEQALEILKKNGDGKKTPQFQKLEQRLVKAKACDVVTDNEEQFKARVKILKAVPRNRPHIYKKAEYFAIGHDDATSMYDPSLEKDNRKENSISFFFCGIGDARHLMRTIVDVAVQEKKVKEPSRTYHFLINDSNAYMLARDLFIFMLLDELSNLDHSTEKGIEILTTVYLVYISTFLPTFAFNHLLRVIDKALTAIKSGSQPLPSFHLHPQDFVSYIKVFSEWKRDAQTLMTNMEAMKVTAAHLALDRNTSGAARAADIVGRQCLEDRQLYCLTGFLRLPPKMMDKYCSFIKKTLAKSKDISANASLLMVHVAKNWLINPTMIDVDFYNYLYNKSEYELGHDPVQLASKFFDKGLPTRPKPGDGLFEHITPLFIDTANALKKLKGRVKVEPVLGDGAEVLEKLHFGLYRDTRPKDFPVSFDRIHFSNVPDYMCGTLSTCLYTPPLLKKFPSSHWQAICLRNAPIFLTFESYLAEYQCISDTTMFQQLTQVEMISKPTLHMPMADYFIYRLASTLPADFGKLLPKKSFYKWFHGVFFRLALPMAHDRSSQQHVYTPVNLTILFRLIAHLRTLGYPSHWLSEVLLAVVEDKLVTSARPPRHRPNILSDHHPERKLSTAPFRHEMKTLASIFSPTLPFSIPSLAIPSADQIHRYSFSLPSDGQWVDDTSATLDLIFYKTSPLSVLYETNNMNSLGLRIASMMNPDLFRPFLDPSADEVNSTYKAQKFHDLREKGLVVWTTFDWDIKTFKASAWMHDGIVDKMMKEGWKVDLVRIDMWESLFASPPVVGKVVEKGECWGAGGPEVDLDLDQGGRFSPRH